MRKLLLILLGVISFGVIAQSPGGSSSNLVFWIKADAGTSTTTDGANVWGWTDQSGNGISPWISSAPTYVESASNYYPALSFNNSILGLNNASINGASTAKTIVMAFKTGADVTTRQVLFEQGSNSTGINIYIDNGSLVCDLYVSSTDYADSYAISANTAYTLIFVYDGSNTEWEGYVNGNLEMYDYGAPSNLPADWNNCGIGCIRGTAQFDGNQNAGQGGDRFTGELMEMVYYDSEVFDQVQREDMFSYLGSKYGITIDDDYYYTGFGSRWWDQSANSTYHNDVASIVRDDLTDLDSKQGKSANSDALVSIAYSAFATNNPLNGNSYPSDEEAFVWGNDDGSIAAFTSTGAPSGRLILGRTWYFEEDITANMEVRVPDDSSPLSTVLPAENSTIYLLADNNSDFSSGATEFAMTQVGDNWEVSANLDGFSYFTFATQTSGGGGSPGPGGQAANLVFWLKADADVFEDNGGTNPCENGDNVRVWGDQSGNNNDAEDYNTDPDWNEVALNYNPAVDFSVVGNNGGLGLDDDADINTGSATNKTIIVAFETGASLNGHQMIFEQGGSQDNINIYIYDGDLYCDYVDNNNDNFGSVAVTANTAYVLILVADGSNTDFVAHLNGSQVFADNTAPSSWPGDNDDIGIGRIRGSAQYHNDGFENAADPFEGKIMEIVYYNNDAFDANERADMFSYLGAKYAITVDHDYNFAGGGSEYWDQATNSTYHNDIAGWIRDDLTLLDQRQAISSSSDALVSIANGSLAASNADNGNAITGDGEYFFWGNDDGAISFSTTGAPTNRQILGRTWLIEENGSGSIEISVPDNSSAASTTLPAEETTIYLLADTDDDFSTGATEITMTLNGTEWEATTNLSAFNYFTFATEVPLPDPGPGGVDDNLVFWLKADAGTNTTTDGANVNSWDDQSGNNNDAFDLGTDPDYDAVLNSYNPAINFTVTSDGLGLNNDNEINAADSDAKSYAIVFRTSSDVNTRQLIYEEGGGTHGLNIYIESGNLHTNLWVSSGDNDASTPISANTSYIAVFVYNGASGRWDTYVNGSLAMSDASVPGTLPSHTGAIGLGEINNTTQYDGNNDVSDGDGFNGWIMEMAYYNEKVLTPTELGDINSYLGAKYGITVDQDYTFGNAGSVFWDQSANSTYHNDIAVWIRDDVNELDQKQAISANDDAMVSMATGSLAADNASNANTIATDRIFMAWGNDNGSISFSGSGAPAGRQILGRTWRIEESGTGSVEIIVPDNLSAAATTLPPEENTVYLLLDTDADFSSGATEVSMTLNGTEWEATTNLSAYNYFTFATDPSSFPKGPGGVIADLDVWLRADTGTSTTTDGVSLTTWTDISTQANDATSDGNPPTYRDNLADNFNFYPTVDFDGSNDRMVLDLSAIKSGAGNGDYTLFAVGSRDDASFNIVLGSEGGSGNQDLHFGYRNGTTATLAHWGNDLDVNVPSWNAGGVTPYLLSGWYNGSNRVIEEFRNGGFNRDTDGNTTDLGGSKTNYLGDLQSVSNYNGRITEVAVFSNDITDLQKLQVYSYFIVKYGLIYTNDNDDDGTPNEVISGSIEEGDLVAGDGSTLIWDYDVMGATYFNDVAGIGYDTLSALNHKQSKSLSTDALVTIGLGSIASSNLTNVNSFSGHNSFLLWGNDNGSLTGAASNANLTPQSGAVDQLQRVWKINETGSVGSVQIAFPKSDIDSYLNAYSEGSLYLRVADDAALTSNATDVALSEISVNGVTSYACNHDFDGTKYFTIIQKGFILWDGSEWRGGLSSITDHAPSDEAGDTTKPMYIQSGDTAVITEAVVVDSVDIEAGAVLRIDPLNCLRTDSITSSGDLILEADATGYAQYKGPAVSATMKQYVDNEGWHLIGSPFSDATWDDLSFENSTAVFNHPVGGSSLDSCNYCNLWWYDGSTDNGQDIGFMASTAYGTWRTSTDGTEAFVPTKGWNMYFDANQNFGAAPWTIVFNGTFNDGPVTQVVNENNSGWNLVANPYPTVLDWDVIDDDLASEGIAAGYHIWDHANTNFAVYSGGSGTLGATRYIAPMQGFYVQTATAGAQNGGDVFHNFNLDNDDRPNPCQNTGGNNFKSSISEKLEIKLRTTHTGSGKIDEVVIQLYEGAYKHFSPQQDIRKLLTTYMDVPSVYVRKGESFAAIASVPMPYEQDSIPLGVYTRDGSKVKIEVVEAPFGYTLYLEDVVTGRWYNLESAHQFEQMAQYPHRFVLHYSRGDIETRDWTLRNPFDLHVDADDMLVIKSLKRLENTDWHLYDMSGKVVLSGKISALNGTTDRIYIGDLKSGVYIFALLEGDVRYTEKLPKLK